jgi:NAD-dependent deacetylase
MQLATADAFRRHPARVFGWYLWRFKLVRSVDPHPGHLALAAMAQRSDDGLPVVTQNVDGLHRRAGSTELVELHGSLERFRCFDRGHAFDAAVLESMDVPESGEVTPPACPICGSPIRPGVVWFGEMLPPGAFERAQQLVRDCDALLVIGTSSVVYPAAALPEIAASRGVTVIEINPEQTPLTAGASLWWSASAAEALPELAEALGSPGGHA